MKAFSFQHCVSIIAIDPEADEILLTRKIKGPAQLIGKKTFPGGKVQAGDPSATHAAARAAFEESALVVRPEDLVHLTRRANDHTRLDVFVAVADLRKTGPQPHVAEPVFRASWSKTKQDAIDRPHDYANDTAYLLSSVESVAQLRRRLSWGAGAVDKALVRKSP